MLMKSAETKGLKVSRGGRAWQVRERRGRQDRVCRGPYANGMEYADLAPPTGPEVLLDLNQGPVYIRAFEKVTHFTHV